PPKPKRLYGREVELQAVLETLTKDSPRIAILGGGGMGKTALARAVLHHSETCTKFGHRFFVSAESATTALELAALIGLHVGLEPGPDNRNSVISFFSLGPPSFLVLDNLETPWEPIQSRLEVEEFLSLLTDIDHLAMLITMRGAERPGRVRWTRPFLLPLQPLTDTAAQQVFEDITDDYSQSKEKTKLLGFTENMPLALDLMAHLVDHEGLSNVVARWDTEKTSLLSAGHGRTSNLDASITTSLSGPRVTFGAKQLLSLLSILPDGLSDAELVQSNLPISEILSCKSVLLATSLVYSDTKNRLRSLVPIREHIRKFHPPSKTLIHAIRNQFHALLGL
ncbi:hypothetical protein B0H16DRAFT_1223841, partial [Mycena metata]